MTYSFEPQGKRAKQINLQMRYNLAESFEHIKEALSSEFSLDCENFNQIILGLKEGKPYSSLLFALYTKLVINIQNENFEDIDKLLQLIYQQTPLQTIRPDFVTLNSKNFLGEGKLLADMMNIEEGTDFSIVSTSDNSAKNFSNRLMQSLDVINQYLPELSYEINALVTQIIMVEPAKDSTLLFDGGSSYMLWSGLFLNAKSHDSVIALVEVLAHEASHMLLFGFAAEESLTLNSDDERFRSPLRDDARPMEGIYHAMFAAARMFWAMNSLLDTNMLVSEEIDYAQKRVQSNLKAYFDAYQVVEEQALLTDTGKKIHNETWNYMRSHLKAYNIV